MFCLDLGHRQGIPSLELAQHTSAGNLVLATFLPMKKSPLCLPAFLPFLPGNISHLASHIFLVKR